MADTVPGPGGQPIAQLEGLISLPEIGEELGITKQGVHSMVFTYATFAIKDLRFVGRPDHPLYLVRESAWKAELVRRERAEQDRQAVAEQAEAERAEEVRTIELRRRMRALLGEAGIRGRQVRNEFVSDVLGYEVDDWYGRTAEEATRVITHLEAQANTQG